MRVQDAAVGQREALIERGETQLVCSGGGGGGAWCVVRVRVRVCRAGLELLDYIVELILIWTALAASGLLLVLLPHKSQRPSRFHSTIAL